MISISPCASALTFRRTTFSIIDRNGQPWLKASEIAAALGYASDDAISRIYRRRADEFTTAMTETVKLTASGNLTSEARIFSLRGAHLLAMFARTAVAAEFRRWVLDILDREVSPAPSKPAARHHTPDPIPRIEVFDFDPTLLINDLRQIARRVFPLRVDWFVDSAVQRLWATIGVQDWRNWQTSQGVEAHAFVRELWAKARQLQAEQFDLDDRYARWMFDWRVRTLPPSGDVAATMTPDGFFLAPGAGRYR